MPLINPDTFLTYALITSPIWLLIVTYSTRAGLRRLVGALAGGFAYAALNIGWDIVGYYTGWWNYPFTMALYVMLLFYVADALSLLWNERDPRPGRDAANRWSSASRSIGTFAKAG